MSLSPEDCERNEQALYQKLLYYLPNPYGVSALMGNIAIESAHTFDGRIVQGYNANSFDSCIAYTSRIDRGEISRNDFVRHAPNGGGYGLCQWTWYTRKENLYDRKGSNSIGDMDYQVSHIMFELNGDYSPTRARILGANESNFYDVVVYILINYESPEDQSTTARRQRYNEAVTIFNKYSGLPPLPPHGGGKLPFWLLKKIRDKNFGIV